MQISLNIVMLAAVSLLFGCGQQGALYFPEDAVMESSLPEDSQASGDIQTQDSEQP